jgi:hypothetical protein
MKNSINIGKLLVIPYDSYSNYINLPPSSLDRISKLNITNTYFFELKTNTDLVSYVGVKEFISEESCIEVPSWLAESLGVDYVNITLIKNIPKGEYIKIEPQSEDFFALPNNDKLVEVELAKYCLLQLNQIISMKIFDKVYEFKIIEIKDHDIIDIINIDLNVDFVNKFLKEEIVVPKVETDLDFGMLPQVKNEEKGRTISEILGGTTVDISQVREARLKYYENKMKELAVKSEVIDSNQYEKKEVIIEEKLEVIETKSEEKTVVEIEQKVIIEEKPDIIEEKPDIVEEKPDIIENKEKVKKSRKKDIDTDVPVKPKRKYVKKNKLII